VAVGQGVGEGGGVGGTQPVSSQMTANPTPNQDASKPRLKAIANRSETGQIKHRNLLAIYFRVFINLWHTTDTCPTAGAGFVFMDFTSFVGLNSGIYSNNQFLLKRFS
jgi:hypothetical protein